MKELLDFLAEKGDDQIAANLLLILKGNYGKLRKFKFTTKNYKLRYNGDIEERELVFKADIWRYKEKYSEPLLQRFYTYWSEHTQNGDRMKWENEKTWETGKRLSTWFCNQQRNGY
jgi:hypothetical protein